MVVGVLLVNLGTPLSSNDSDVKRYLTEFLTDKRVIDLSWWKRQLLVRGRIVRKRYRESARTYRSIWTKAGSPLLMHGQKVKERLQERLGNGFSIALSMRYQFPSIHEGLLSLRHCHRLVILPLFPQYASATTGSVYEEVMRRLSSWRMIPELRFVHSFPMQKKMVRVFAENTKACVLKHYDHILMSFHGLPKRQLQHNDPRGKGDCCQREPDCCMHLGEENRLCYVAQCNATARAIAGELGLDSQQYTLCYQSRLGKEEWLQPYFSEELKRLAKGGMKKLLVLSPSFVCDCLETLDEIAVGYAKEFKKLGGERLDLVPGLNDHPLWIEALCDLINDEEALNRQRKVNEAVEG
ncbi:ferrochelatase [Simkania negevensis]|uniref:Ferrochelatase n=1 Tax=Simkania negevensis TaxID=83561 RepID=A0ABS3AQ26_9BACT|nr:ferrochelatase [Simkania negevensis]